MTARETHQAETHQAIEATFRIERARLIAGLARMVRNVELAEELAQDALVVALAEWPKTGVPANPGAWLMAVAKRRAIDAFRRDKMRERKHEEIARTLDETRGRAAEAIEAAMDDDLGDELRARVLGDLGAIEHGRTFAALLGETLLSVLRTYGPAGAIRTLRNMTRIQRRMMPQLNALDRFASPPRAAVPVHYVFGGNDALNPPAIVNRLPAAIAAPATTVTVLPNAGHFVHFDHPQAVRSIVASA